jgi:site-specific DNA-methyltransferase (adenine-specific)
MTAPYAVLCGDCRDLATVRRLMDGEKANVVITSPPYAAQREYDKSSGFEPIPPDKYIEWYRAVSDSIKDVLAPDGSYFLNIKEHAEDVQRHLYVKKLVIAHVEQWGWRFVDEFCWRKTNEGVPGGWKNRFKNAFEPVFHFVRQERIKFRPGAVSHETGDYFSYSPNNPKSRSGSGLLGCGPRGSVADRNANSEAWQKTRRNGDHDKRVNGLARPSNVIEAKTESSEGDHSAPFPVALVKFFIQAFSDPGDLVWDPFGGSGTTCVAALLTGRRGRMTEISPAYCDIAVQRLLKQDAKLQARLADGGATFDQARFGRNLEKQDAVKEEIFAAAQ